MATHYSISNPDHLIIESNVQLTARTDKGARVQAKREAKNLGWGRYVIHFFRDSDHCKGILEH